MSGTEKLSQYKIGKIIGIGTFSKVKCYIT